MPEFEFPVAASVSEWKDHHSLTLAATGQSEFAPV